MSSIVYFKEKYLKYKKKYFELKQQMGGSSVVWTYDPEKIFTLYPVFFNERNLNLPDKMKELEKRREGLDEKIANNIRNEVDAIQKSIDYYWSMNGYMILYNKGADEFVFAQGRRDNKSEGIKVGYPKAAKNPDEFTIYTKINDFRYRRPQKTNVTHIDINKDPNPPTGRVVKFDWSKETNLYPYKNSIVDRIVWVAANKNFMDKINDTIKKIVMNYLEMGSKENLQKLDKFEESKDNTVSNLAVEERKFWEEKHSLKKMLDKHSRLKLPRNKLTELVNGKSDSKRFETKILKFIFHSYKESEPNKEYFDKLEFPILDFLIRQHEYIAEYIIYKYNPENEVPEFKGVRNFIDIDSPYWRDVTLDNFRSF